LGEQKRITTLITLGWKITNNATYGMFKQITGSKIEIGIRLRLSGVYMFCF